MLDIFNCALVWVVEDIINSNLAGIRWYSDYLQLFTNNSNNNKIYIVKKKKKKNEEKKRKKSCYQNPADKSCCQQDKRLAIT